MPIILASSMIPEFGSTILSFPATSPNGTLHVSPFTIPTIYPYSSSTISFAARAPSRVESTRSYGTGEPPLCVCPNRYSDVCTNLLFDLICQFIRYGWVLIVGHLIFIFLLGKCCIFFRNGTSATARIVKPFFALFRFFNCPHILY